MRHRWSGIVLAAFVAASASAADTTPPAGRSLHRLVLRDLRADHANYLLYVPASYSASPASAGIPTDLAHDCWTITYRDSRLYLWFLEHSLSRESRNTASSLSARVPAHR
jgi:hypothetical protein